MPRFTKKELTGYVWFGIVLAVAGFLTALLIKPDPDPNDYWYAYKVCGRWSGWMLFAVALVWTALALAHLLTDFFTMEKSAGADEFTISLIAIGVVALILAVWLPDKIDLLQPRPFRNEDQSVLSDMPSLQAHLKAFVQCGIWLAGAALASFPTLRFFKK